MAIIGDPLLPAGAGLMFMLGLRHGLDPDHIAAIDGMTLQVLRTRNGLARWVGTLFSLGHGTVITAIAVGVGIMSGKVELPAFVSMAANWLPIVLLLTIGLGNLHTLLTQSVHAMPRWNALRLAGPLARGGHPVGIFMVGVIFALVFDTAGQAAAWGYAATVHGGPVAALLVGLAFTLGMMVTDTVDSRVVAGILKNAEKTDVRRFRRLLGWSIVAASLGMAGYGIAVRIEPSLGAGGDAYTLIGLALFAPFAVGYAWILWGMHKRARQSRTARTDGSPQA